jgi:hydrogenase expression/formation protein HypC
VCLAVPGQVVEVRDNHGTAMATVDFAGIRKEVCLAYVPEAKLGDYVLVHVGFAISVVDQDSAAQMLEALRDIASIEAELGSGVEPGEEGVGG